MLPRKWKDSIVPLQWAEPRRRVPGRSHKHSLIIPSRAFDSRNTLKNKQPINLSFLVCLGIQSSNELAPWRSQTPHCTPSTVPPHSSAPPPHRRMQSVPAKALGSGGPDGPNEGCPGQTQGARNWKQRILVWPQEPPPPHVTSGSNENCVVMWLGEEAKSSVCLFLSQVDSHSLGKEGPVSIASQSWLPWWQEGLLHGWALGAVLWKHSWAFCLSKNYQVRSLSFQGGKEKKDSGCFTLRSFRYALFFK